MHAVLINDSAVADPYFIDVAVSCIMRGTRNEAKMYCQFLNHNGYTDWRLPVYDEIRDLSKFLTKINRIDAHHYWINDRSWPEKEDNFTGMLVIPERTIIPVRSVKNKTIGAIYVTPNT
jgi:hypothetical protein